MEARREPGYLVCVVATGTMGPSTVVLLVRVALMALTTAAVGVTSPGPGMDITVDPARGLLSF